jgi:TfoX/Sxy family transcriptional regulator of competence genes
MAYDKPLAARVRQAFNRRGSFIEKEMFGGAGFLINGNMCVGVWKEFLIVRLDPEDYDAALTEPGVRKFDITGRVMPGWVMVERAALDGPPLRKWVQQAVQYVKALPAKTKKKVSKRK